MQKQIRRFFSRHLRKMRFLPPKMYVHFLYEYHTGKRLDLKNPEEFNAKIQWYKVFYHPKILNQLVDKYAVRSYVEQKIGSEYLNDIYGVYNNADDLNYDKLPNRFVLKATHSSSHNLIVEDKSELDKEKTKKTINKWLSKNQYYRIGQEWAYKDVQPRFIAEKFLEQDGRSSLTDYKFYCFNGEVKFADIHIDRFDNHQQSCYDLDFNLLPFTKGKKEKMITSKLEKPSNFDTMVQLSKTLAANYPFVRVDFYSINGKSIFGEMTFYPGDGRKDFYPEKYNKIIGDYFELPKLDNGKIITEIS